MSALIERRTRRVAQGVSIDAEGLSWQSKNPPSPLSKLEEAVLIVSLGVTGVSTHDGPLKVPGGGTELGSPFLNVVARTGSSADNCQATHFFMINDEGIWLLKQPRGQAALAELKDLPPRWADWKEADWIAAAGAAKVKVSDRRMEYPREYPYYLGWNKQMSNRPGTTLFLPLVDCTWQYINAVLIMATEPDGKPHVAQQQGREGLHTRPPGAGEVSPAGPGGPTGARPRRSSLAWSSPIGPWVAARIRPPAAR